jgi:hypothetical protein
LGRRLALAAKRFNIGSSPASLRAAASPTRGEVKRGDMIPITTFAGRKVAVFGLGTSGLLSA